MDCLRLPHLKSNAPRALGVFDVSKIDLWFNLILPCSERSGVRVRSGRMSAAMIDTAAAQELVGTVLPMLGHIVWVFTSISTAGWHLSAWLFRTANWKFLRGITPLRTR